MHLARDASPSPVQLWTRLSGVTTSELLQVPAPIGSNRELNQQRLGLIDLILCEVLQGIREDSVPRASGSGLEIGAREPMVWIRVSD